VSPHPESAPWRPADRESAVPGDRGRLFPPFRSVPPHAAVTPLPHYGLDMNLAFWTMIIIVELCEKYVIDRPGA
jgi:hypothetical protein